MACLDCGQGFHSTCYTNCEECHPDIEEITQIATTLTSATGSVGAPLKNLEDMKDYKSTGRKRAAKQYAIIQTLPCEWRGFKNVGGGKHPIAGCVVGFQKDIHHGPIKNPIRNERANIHLICKPCHNRWHAANDPDYDEVANMYLPHKPESATDEELWAADLEWKIR